MTIAGINHRKSLRVDLQIPVRMSDDHDDEITLSDSQSFYISSLTELCSDGAFVCTTAAYPPGSYVALDFEIPGRTNQHHTVHTVAEVAWIGAQKASQNDPAQSPIGVGVRFVNISSGERDLIDFFVRSQLLVNGTHRKSGRV